jgi:CheY-like chemotaxis protein
VTEEDKKTGGPPPPPRRRAPKPTIQTGAARVQQPAAPGKAPPAAPPANQAARLPPKPPSAPGRTKPGAGQPRPAPPPPRPASKGAPLPRPPAKGSPAAPPRPASGAKPAPGAAARPASSAKPAPGAAARPTSGAKPAPAPARPGAPRGTSPGTARPAPAARPAAGRTGTPAGGPAQKATAKPAPSSPPGATDEDRPTLLVIGKLGPIESALRTALVQRGMHVETSTKDEAVTTAFAAAPDLILLAGDAAQHEGGEVIELLAKHPATSVLPVILLADDPSLERRLQAFRHGAVAVVPRSASVDEMARRITDLSKEVHDRPGHTKGELGEASLDELVALLSNEVRGGILSVRTGEERGDATQARFVLRAGRPVQQAIEQFVHRLRPLIRETEAPLQYTFEESTVARLDMLDGATGAEPASRDSLQGRRVLLVHDNPAQADVLAQELRARGATVVVSDGEGSALGRARDLDPDVVLVDANGMDTWAYRIMTQLRQDPRLRWASMLLVDWNEVWSPGAPAPDVDRLAAGIDPLIEPDNSLAARAKRDETFDTRLEILGPGRTLRALADTGETLHVNVRHPRATVEVDVAEGLIAGAVWHRAEAPSSPEEGPAALAALLALSSGRVRVERREVPSKANVMAPVPDALQAAVSEAQPLAPSIPPADGGPPGAAPEPATTPWANPLADHSADFDVDLEDEPTRVSDGLPGAGSMPQPAPAPAATPPGPGSQPEAVPPELVHELRSLVQELRATRASSSGQVQAPGAPPAAAPAPNHPRPVRAPAAPASPPPAPVAATAAPAAQVDETLPVEALEERPGRLGKIVLGVALVAGVGLGIVLAFMLGGDKAGGGDGATAASTAGPPAQLGAGAPGAPAEQATAVPPEAPAPPVAPTDEADEGAAEEDDDEDPDPEALADDEEADDEEDGDEEDGDEAAEATEGEEIADDGEDADADGDEAEEGVAAAGDEVADEDEDEADDEEDEVEGTSKAQKRRQVVNRLIVRANGLRRARRYSQAAALYKRALRIHPRNTRAIAGLVRTYMATGNKRAAVQYARRLVKVRPGVAANYVLLGDTLAAAGDKAGARRAWRRALRIAPGYKPARQRLQ